MSANTSRTRLLLRAIVFGGLAGAIIEMVFVLPIQAMLGTSPVAVFQFIAMGVLGKAAFAGGAATVALGIFLHGLISLIAAGVFLFAALRWRIARSHPAISGMLFGIAAYVVMTYMVLPLTPIGFMPPNSILLVALSIGVHIFAFGLPIALVVASRRYGIGALP